MNRIKFRELQRLNKDVLRDRCPLEVTVEGKVWFVLILKEGYTDYGAHLDRYTYEVFEEKARQEGLGVEEFLKNCHNWLRRKIEEKWEEEERPDRSTDQGDFGTKEVD